MEKMLKVFLMVISFQAPSGKNEKISAKKSATIFLCWFDHFESRE